jgi:hypothetical protein
MEMEPIARLTKDLAVAARTLNDTEARFLVDTYYQFQDDRKRANNQVRALGEAAEPNSVLVWLASQSTTLENQIKRALDQYTQAHVMGAWMREIVGIGPILSAGLLAHIDIAKAPAVGHIWRFAGLDPTSKWGKGEKCPWNSQLKKLCWLIGESFVKVKAHEDDVYGKLYDERKKYEAAKNDAGEYAEQAAALLAVRPTHAQKATYALGRLPDGHLHMRAKRYAVKQFLSDLHGAWYRTHFGTEPPLPYPIAILGHAHVRRT